MAPGDRPAARKKPDKLRNLLKEAEQIAALRLKELNELSMQRETLKRKEEVLQQIIEGLTTAAQLMTASEHFNSATDKSLLDRALTSLMQLELQIQHTFTENPTCEVQPSKVSKCVQFLHHVFDPVRVQQVLAMSDAEVIGRLRALAGRCAIMLVQEPSQAAIRGASPTTGSASAAPSAAGLGGAAAAGAVAGACHSVAEDSNSNAAVQGAEFEYNCLASILLTWDVDRFTKHVGFTNLETGEPLVPPPAEFWRRVAYKLQLSNEQIASFKGLKDVLATAMTTMFAEFRDSAKQQEAIIQQQECNLSELHAQQQQFLQQQYMQYLQQQQTLLGLQPPLLPPLQQQHAAAEGPTSGGGALQEAHADLLSKQKSLLTQWHIFWMHMGMVTQNTLTPRQMAILVAGSYPSIIRIDPVLDFLDELEQHNKQQDEQQQQQQAEQKQSPQASLQQLRQQQEQLQARQAQLQHQWQQQDKAQAQFTQPKQPQQGQALFTLQDLRL